MLTLCDAIAQLRAEISRAAIEAATQDNEGVILTIEEARVDLQVTYTTEVKGGAEVSFWVVKLSGEASGSEAQANTVSVTLKPRDLAGQPISVASRNRPLPVPPHPPGSSD
jgi:hypothetical protein